MLNLRHLGVTLIAAAALAACSSSNSLTVSGTVVGSYFRNALVCVDINRNARCEPNEPSARTDNNGQFTVPQIEGADLVAEIGPDAQRYEPQDGVVNPVTNKIVFRAKPALLSNGAVVLNAYSTHISGLMEAGKSMAEAQQLMSSALGVPAANALADYNRETDPVLQGVLQSHANRMIAALQATVKATGSGNLLAALTDLVNAAPTQQGQVQYVWTQVGADDTPFSKLEITGTSAGSLADKPDAAGTLDARTFTTALQAPNATLYAAGQMVARAIVTPDAAGAASCPQIRIDGVASTMAVRAPVARGKLSNGPRYGSSGPVDFNVLTCEAAIPDTATSAVINGVALKVRGSKSVVNRVVVMGDTGCRLKGPTAFNQAADGTSTGGDLLQDCTSETAWPYAKLARVAASFDPDLILHNGDIHYREGFPEGVEMRWGGAANAAKGGSERDNASIKAKFVAAKIDDATTYGWRSWEEDFFKASGPLLAAAPWAITRGNHELCDRAGQGWFRFLDARRFPAGEPEYDSAYVRGSSFNVAKNCSQAVDPVAMSFGDLQVVLLDVGLLNDQPGLSGSIGATNGDHVRVARQLNAISALPASQDPNKLTWIVSHKPFFAYSGAFPAAGNAPKSADPRTWQLQKAIMPGAETLGTGNGQLPPNTQMTHAGHIHGFQMISHSAASGLPLSVLMGSTGDNLDGLIEGNTGTAFAPKGFGNDITSGLWPWLDQTINNVLVKGSKWYGGFAQHLPVNFSASPITGTGQKETATMSEYSFLVLDRVAGTTNWKMKVYDRNRQLLRTCTTSGKTARCDG